MSTTTLVLNFLLPILATVAAEAAHQVFVFPPDSVHVDLPADANSPIGEPLRSYIRFLDLNPVRANFECRFDRRLYFQTLVNIRSLRDVSIALHTPYRQMLLDFKALRVQLSDTDKCARLADSESGTLTLVDADEFYERLRRDFLNRTCTFVFFYSAHCPFSLYHYAKLNMIPRYYRNMRFLALNVDSARALAIRYGVVSVPYAGYFIGGRLVNGHTFPSYASVDEGGGVDGENSTSRVQYDAIAVDEFDVMEGAMRLEQFGELLHMYELDLYTYAGLAMLALGVVKLRWPTFLNGYL